MADRSSRPKRSPKQTAATIAAEIATLRRQRLTGKHIAKQTGVSAATVSRVLRRAGLSRLKDIEPAAPVRRYERENPGEMLHIDIKKLGRFDRVGHRITATAPANPTAAASAGSSSMVASTTPRASPSRRFCRTKDRQAPSPSSRRRSPTTNASASRSSAS